MGVIIPRLQAGRLPRTQKPKIIQNVRGLNLNITHVHCRKSSESGVAGYTMQRARQRTGTTIRSDWMVTRMILVAANNRRRGTANWHGEVERY
jgi:hypothetical protein